MSNIYLRSVEFSNFRVYGDSYAYELPDGPGVTLISGPNGLGKTSFFDGLEWALTGEISRFLEIPSDARRKEVNHLTRYGAPSGSHRVSVQFSEGAPIDRGMGFTPSDSKVAGLLKCPEWPEITNLRGYLSLTHFLGQSSTQRFMVRKPGAQWEALKGPAGIDRINALRERISGQGVRRAFTRAIGERSDRLAETTAELASWNSLIAERDRARQLAAADHVIGPQGVLVEIDHLAKAIATSTPDLESMKTFSSESAEEAIERFALVVQEMGQSNEGEAERIAQLSSVATAYTNSHSLTAELTKRAGDIEAKRKGSADKLQNVEVKLVEETSKLQNAERKEALEQNKLSSLSRLEIAYAQFQGAQARVAETTNQLNICATKETDLKSKINDINRQLHEALSVVSERRVVAEHLNLIRARAQHYDTLTFNRSEKERIELLIQDKNELSVRKKRETSLLELEQRSKYMAELTAELKQHDDRIRALTEAVSLISHRLLHDDTRCPVCRTEFPKGQLLEIVSSAEALQSGPISELAEKLTQARFAADRIRKSVFEFDQKIADIDQLKATLNGLRARGEELLQKFVELGGSSDGHFDEKEIARIEGNLIELDSRLAAGASSENIRASLDQTTAMLSAEATRRVSLEQMLSSIRGEMDAARTILLQQPDIWHEEAGLLRDITAEKLHINEQIRDTGQMLQQCKESFNEARLSRDSLAESELRDTQSLIEVNRRLDGLATDREALMGRWREATETGEPDAARVSQRQAKLNEALHRQAIVRASYARIVVGYRNWMNDALLRKLEEQISEKLISVGAASESETRDMLSANVVRARDALSIVGKTKEKVEEVSLAMQDQAKTFGDDVLMPLNETIQRFARSLMAWTEDSIVYRAEYHATGSALRSGVLKNDMDGLSIPLELNPNLYFSEGQLSALSVAALFAASTTFGWSRWRGMLLDDPLQHNDVIHASAFMDLMRQMVRELGYQIVLSAHDSAETDFFVRKCVSAGIPFHVHTLVPSGDNGLVSLS